MKNFSRQRKLIVSILQNSFEHPTAEEIFYLARQKEKNISLGTVYRNLDMLSKENVIEKISTPIGKVKYDLKKDKHYHAICKLCGEIFDFYSNINLEKLQNDIKKQTKLETFCEELSVLGICEKCQKGEKNENN